MKDQAVENSASSLSAQRYGRLASFGLNTDDLILQPYHTYSVIILLFQRFVSFQELVDAFEIRDTMIHPPNTQNE